MTTYLLVLKIVRIDISLELNFTINYYTFFGAFLFQTSNSQDTLHFRFRSSTRFILLKQVSSCCKYRNFKYVSFYFNFKNVILMRAEKSVT